MRTPVILFLLIMVTTIHAEDPSCGKKGDYGQCCDEIIVDNSEPTIDEID